MKYEDWSWKRTITLTRRRPLQALNVIALEGAFIQEKTILQYIGAFSVIVKTSWIFVSSSNEDIAA